jgi:hypothetical protein
MTGILLWLVFLRQVSEHVGMGQDSGVDAQILAQKMSQLSPEVHSHRCQAIISLINVFIQQGAELLFN